LLDNKGVLGMGSLQSDSKSAHQIAEGYCIYIDTLLDGPVPAERTDIGNPFIYPTHEAAERQIAEDMVCRINEFLNGERDFEDAMTVEEYVMEVDVQPDGSTVDAEGNHFGNNNW
jgi:hypothetical protein